MRIAMVTSWNCACGVAEYSAYFMEAARQAHPGLDFVVIGPIGGGPNTGPYPVHRAWRYEETAHDDLLNLIESLRPDVVHVQYQRSFFSNDGLSSLLRGLDRMAIPCVITFHTTSPAPDGRSLESISQDLRLPRALLVHSHADQQRFASWGISSTVRILPHGNIEFADEDAAAVRAALGIQGFGPVVASFGFLQPHKGVRETIQAVDLLKGEYPRMLYLALGGVQANHESHAYRVECIELAKRLGLERRALILGRFLTVSEVVVALHAADLVVLPYRSTGESASGAIRFALSARRPVLATAEGIFDDVAACVHRISEPRPDLIAEAIREVLGDAHLRSTLVEAAAVHVSATSWGAVARQYAAILQEIGLLG